MIHSETEKETHRYTVRQSETGRYTVRCRVYTVENKERERERKKERACVI